MDNVGAIVLAAGRGTRINSTSQNKVTLEILGVPMVRLTVENLRASGIKSIVAVVGFRADSVKKSLGNRVKYALQQPLLGTGDAVRVGLEKLGPRSKFALIVSGDDSALHPPELYSSLVTSLTSQNADLLLLTAKLKDPAGLGRVIKDRTGKVLRIVEERNASREEKRITEINTSTYCAKTSMLRQLLPKIKPNPVSNELYFTDIIELAQPKYKVIAHPLPPTVPWRGVNTMPDYETIKKLAAQSHEN